ncbi:MAG: nitrophenyl compound nitroreductase subunit ArsF family protein [Candidatus Omnitrophota bacterium]
MKRLFLVILAAVAVISLNYSAFATEDKPAAKVIAYYFHGNFRCPTCQAMEKYSKEAIENNFKNELASGKLEFKAVNTDEQGNEHFVRDYQLYTKSLVLSLVKGGKETKAKNLTQIWDRVRNKQSFIDYVDEEVANFLKEAK